tara:strand:+ start:31 stop:924 length:894 start_codon:yes stop_codon:yes gene_type:complete
MADNTILNLGSGGDTIATDDIGGVKHQRVKIQHGAEGSATDVSTASPLPTTNSALAIAKGEIPSQASFLKFGKNPDIGTAAGEDIWGGGGTYTGFPVGVVETMEVFSSAAADTSAGTGARTVEISNLLDGTGAVMPAVTVSLSGTTPVSLGAQTYSRASRMKVITAGTGGENEGTITLRHTTTTANIFAVMPLLANQTEIACYTVPLGHTLYVNHVGAQMTMGGGTAKRANMSLRARPLGETFQSKLTPTISDGYGYTLNGYNFVFEARTDIKWRADSVSNNLTIVSSTISGILVTD